MCIVEQWKTGWYRARVKLVTKNKNGETVYNVLYIDYGYEEYNIKASRVREIAEHLQILPPQAIRCSLYGIVPKNMNKWTHESTNDFLKLINEA